MFEFKVELYRKESGEVPFERWLRKLQDGKSEDVVAQRIARLRGGNFGEYRDLKNGLLELKFRFGPGYRVYFSQIGGQLVLLLVGGHKGTQFRDIRRAREYLNDYTRRRLAKYSVD